MSDPSPPETSERERRLEEIVVAILAAEDAGHPPMLELLLAQNADLADELKTFLGDYDRLRLLAAPLRAVAAGESAAADTTERDAESTFADASRPPGQSGVTTQTLREALAPTIRQDGDPLATVPNSPNGTGDPDRIKYGTRVRYFGDYELLNVLGRGGMGVVYKARQISLNRPVALKMLQAGILATEDDLRRFQNEAEAVATLDHPHIVPIFEVGHNGDQRYFTMKLIGGPSLDRKLSEFIDNPKAAARLVMTAAEAVHHAHLRGILHRDLKPANVLLDERGEPHVTDFGLAKRVHADSDLTLSGAILGTPPYMAPEQASGKRGMVTTATDVYGLGAVLYALLTGRAPFGSESPLETLEHVRERIPAPPSKHNPRVPRDLEVICLKCLEKQPEMRYASAQTLADDLRRHLKSEAILARPVGLATRAWMWCERNPALARLWFALMLTLFLFLATWGGIFIVVIEGARRTEAAARDRAETNFDMAQKAVEDYTTSVSENTLLKEQDTVEIRSLRHDLLKSALVYYQRFAAQRSEDPAVRKQLAQAYFQVGQITKEIGSSQDAIGAFRSAQSIWELLVKTNPKQHELLGYLAECDLAIGRLQSATNNRDEALRSLTHARAILERLAVEHPPEASYQSSLADCYSELGIIHAKLGQSGQGMVLLEKAKAIRQRLISQYPEKLDYQKTLAETINVIGWTQYSEHDNAAALKSFQEVQDSCLAILKKVTVGPKPIWLLNLLSLSQYNIASIHQKNGDLGKALQSFEQSLRDRSALADSYPSVLPFQAKLGMSYREIAAVQHEAHEDAKAFQSIQKSIDIFNDLVRSHPEQASYHSELGMSWNYLGVLYDDARKHAEAVGPFQQAVTEQQLAVDRSKDVDLYKEYLCNHLDNLGEQYLDLGRVAEGLPHYRRALRIRRQLKTTHPKDREHSLAVAKALIVIGTIERHDGDSDAAGQCFSDARKLLKLELGAAPTEPALQVQLAEALHDEASALADLAKPDDARPLLERAVELIRPGASRAAPNAARGLPREALSEALWDLARVLRALNSLTAASRADAERLDLWKDRPPGELVALALKQTTTRATLIGHGKTAISARAQAVRELDLDQAASELKLAVSRGFKDLKMLRSDPDSPILLGREDLKSLIKGLESSGQPSGPRTP